MGFPSCLKNWPYIISNLEAAGFSQIMPCNLNFCAMAWHGNYSPSRKHDNWSEIACNECCYVPLMSRIASCKVILIILQQKTQLSCMVLQLLLQQEPLLRVSMRQLHQALWPLQQHSFKVRHPVYQQNNDGSTEDVQIPSNSTINNVWQDNICQVVTVCG